MSPTVPLTRTSKPLLKYEDRRSATRLDWRWIFLDMSEIRRNSVSACLGENLRCETHRSSWNQGLCKYRRCEQSHDGLFHLPMTHFSLFRVWNILTGAHLILIYVTNGWTSSRKINWVASLFIVFMVLAGKSGWLMTSCSLASVSLSRSPVLVAMALREAGMSRQESIDYVRTRRRGSFNVRQLEFLQNYPSAHRLAAKHAACLIM